MVGKSILHAGNTILLALIIVSSAAGQRHAHVLKAHVHFLATSTSVHFGEGWNQDIYLIELAGRAPGGQPTLARLIDEYPSYRSALSRSTLASESGRAFRLVRDSDCDRLITQMPLRTTPGDPAAILPEKLGYSPDLSSAASHETLLPCYRLVRP
jgi:hypothetical protein